MAPPPEKLQCVGRGAGINEVNECTNNENEGIVHIVAHNGRTEMRWWVERVREALCVTHRQDSSANELLYNLPYDEQQAGQSKTVTSVQGSRAPLRGAGPNYITQSGRGFTHSDRR